MNTSHTLYLQHALALAQKRRGFCAPNPSVGVVVVKNDQIIATGFHLSAGEPHAEVEAFKCLSKEESKGATAYITLEPCCHQGKTPPCTEFLIRCGVKAVYYGFVDPNPQVLGQGEAQLRAAGIECIHLSLPEIDAFYQSYLYWVRTKRPFVTAKLAMSLDGKIAGAQGARIAITGKDAQIFTHQYRKKSDALLTTVKTVIKDDPALNVRLPDEEIQPKIIYVLDKNLDFPSDAALFKTAKKITLFHKDLANEKRRLWLESQGVRCVQIPLKEERIDANQVLNYIGSDGVHDLLLEAGGICFEAFMLEKQIQRAFVYVALKWLGADAQMAFDHETAIFKQAQNLKWHVLGDDVVCEFFPQQW